VEKWKRIMTRAKNLELISNQLRRSRLTQEHDLQGEANSLDDERPEVGIGGRAGVPSEKKIEHRKKRLNEGEDIKTWNPRKKRKGAKKKSKPPFLLLKDRRADIQKEKSRFFSKCWREWHADFLIKRGETKYHLLIVKTRARVDKGGGTHLTPSY